MRSIVHWTGDHFFASIEQAADQRLRNRPVAIGGERRAMVASASAEAVRFGVRTGMPVRRALRACPKLIVIPGHFELYERFFQQMLAVCEEKTPLVEPASIGSAYLDLTGTKQLHQGGAAQTAEEIRRTVQDWLRVSLSAGIGSNKTVARIGARTTQPAGQLVVPAGHEADFLAPHPLRWLEGLPAQALETLQIAGIRTIGDLARSPTDALQLAVGKAASGWQRKAQGVDEEPVRPKSAQEPAWQESFEFTVEQWEEPVLQAAVRKLLERLLTRLREQRMEARRLRLRIRYIDRAESEASLALRAPSDLDDDFLPHLPELLRSAWKRRVRIRALFLSVASLYRPSAQLSLFGDFKRDSGALRKLAVTLDTLRQKYGGNAIRRGVEETSVEEHAV